MSDILVKIGILVTWFGEMVQEIGEGIEAYAVRLYMKKNQ